MTPKSPPNFCRCLVALAVGLISIQSARAELVISEFLARATSSSLADEDGAPSDWIEIHNPDAVARSTAGYFLTDSASNLVKWQLPDVEVAVGGYLIVFASGKDRAVAGSELHTNFSLGGGGEFLALVAPGGDTAVSVFSPEFPEQYENVSYGTGTGGALGIVELISESDSLSYLAPIEAVPDWETFGFDDGSWATSTNGVGWGYPLLPGGSGPTAFETAARFGRPSALKGSAYLRYPFTVENAAEVFSMAIEVLYEDGFVVFLNGHEVASSNAPASPAFDSIATDSIEENDGPDFFPINFAGHLQDGANVLAVQMMNNSTGSSDVYFQAKLAAEVVDLSLPPQLGYFEEPTPGAPNGILSAAPPSLVDFSVTGRAFSSDFPLTLSVPNPSAVIHYTLDGSVPTNEAGAASPTYSAPITINTSVMVRAKAFLPGTIDGTGRSEGYMKLDASQVNFSSDLPIVLVSKFSAGDPPGANSAVRVPGFMLIYEPDPLTGRTTLTGEPALGTRCGYRKRGSSSGGFDKYAMALESWDESDEDVDIRPLGFSAEGDWILNSRFQFDQSLIRNPFLYELSNQVGRWAVKTQFIEIFHDATGGNVGSNDYFGVYTFMEKIEPDSGRLDIPDVKPWDNSAPEVTGGYVFKRDRSGAGEQSINGAGMGSLPLTSPNVITTQQRSSLEGYLADMNTALDAPNGINASTGIHFSEYMDVGAWIDNFWLNILSMDPDWGRLSQYFYKEREGPVHAGPIWDYDRTMGSDDGRDDNPRRWDIGDSETWYDSQYPWFGKLLGFTSNNQPTPAANSSRPDVMQQVVDRWYELRDAEFTESNMGAIIDSMADEIREAQARSFVRWTRYPPGNISGQNFAAAGTAGWERDISHLKGWLKARSEWIDEQFFSPPIFNQQGGIVAEGFQLTMNSTEAAIYYTLDGSDPRAPGGAISPLAVPFDGGPVTDVLLSEDASCQYLVPQDDSLEATWAGRTFEDGGWKTGASGLGFENPGGALEPEIVTNIKADLQPPSPGIRNASGYFRFAFDFDNADAINSLLLEIKYDDGFVAHLNGTEIARSSSAPATIAWDSNSGNGWGDPAVADYVFNSVDDDSRFDYDLTAFKSSMINGTNVLAIQGMGSSASGSDFLIKPRLSVNHTVVATPIVLNSSTSVVARAFDGQQWGGPTSAAFVVGAELADANNLVISEIMYNPVGPSASELSAGFTDGDQFEYIEFLNISGSPLDLSAVSFAGGVDFSFFGAPVSSIEPGSRALVVSNQAAFVERYGVGFNSLIAGEFANATALANGGERLVLTGANGTIRDFSYNDRFPWPESPDGDGPSLVLIDPDANPDHAVATNWRASVGGMGSLGAGDSVPFVGDPEADADDDGLSAFAEHAFGTSDSSPNSPDVLVAQFLGGGAFSVTYPRNLAADDALISVEVSTNLNTWVAPVETGSGGEIHNGDGTATFTINYPSTLSAGERFFVRLRVTSR
ncbi:MAG: hypothetical protein ACI9NC_000106 [Verrucomicrobiales bacterium]|jgi:hypothetical protein